MYQPFDKKICGRFPLKYIFISALALTVFLVGTAESVQIKDFINAARKQIGKTLIYDPSYQAIGCPNGDVSIDRGVCTDVIVRALRDAYHFDLQASVHEDMTKNFSEYPQMWGLNQPDKNIDHRRVPNLQTFFKRRGCSLPLSDYLPEFEPGDLVTCIVPPNMPHIMIVSDRLKLSL